VRKSYGRKEGRIQKYECVKDQGLRKEREEGNGSGISMGLTNKWDGKGLRKKRG
jgi:hypothetical protein